MLNFNLLSINIFKGTDVTIVAHSKCVGQSLEAAIELAKLGISAEVINLRTIRPLDIDTVIKSIKKTNKIVSVEGGWSMYGVGSEIAAQIMESNSPPYLDRFDYTISDDIFYSI